MCLFIFMTLPIYIDSNTDDVFCICLPYICSATKENVTGISCSGLLMVEILTFFLVYITSQLWVAPSSTTIGHWRDYRYMVMRYFVSMRDASALLPHRATDPVSPKPTEACQGIYVFLDTLPENSMHHLSGGRSQMLSHVVVSIWQVNIHRVWRVWF